MPLPFRRIEKLGVDNMKEENIKVIQYMFVVLLLNLPVLYMVAGYLATTYMIISSIIGYICINGDELRKFFLYYSQKFNAHRENHSKGDSLAESDNIDKKERDGVSSYTRD